jgi:hypothetical protein
LLDSPAQLLRAERDITAVPRDFCNDGAAGFRFYQHCDERSDAAQ